MKPKDPVTLMVWANATDILEMSTLSNNSDSARLLKVIEFVFIFISCS